MEFDVAQIFNAWITAKFQGQSQVQAWLLRHERKDRCIGSVCQQIRLAELSNIRARFDTFRYRQMIEACAAMFCEAALRFAEEAAMSRAEIARRLSDAARIKEAEGYLHELEAEATTTKLISRPGSVAR